MISSYLSAPILAWLIAQFIKFASATLKSGTPQFKWLWKSGGLPSSHSAIVAALATTIYVLQGVDSVEFAISVVLAMIVIYDAVGVRRATGMNSQALMGIVKDEKQLPDGFRIVLGHRPSEMISGVALGISAGMAVTYATWWGENASGRVELAGAELLTTFVLSLMFVVSSSVLLLWLGKKSNKKLPSASKLRRWTIWGLLLPTLTLLLLAGAANQGISPLSWRIWSWAVVVFILFIQIYLAFSYYDQLPQRLKEEREHFKNNAEQARKRRRKKRKSSRKTKK